MPSKTLPSREDPDKEPAVEAEGNAGDEARQKREDASRKALEKAFPLEPGERLDIHYLWADYFRLNYWSGERQTFTRSHFVACSRGRVTLVHDDDHEERIL